MITAIIRNKENTLVLELPHSIYDIYDKLRSIGIMQPPKRIPLTGNEDDDIGVKLFFKWGIEFDDEHPYAVPDQGNREVKYADKKEIQDGILEKYPPEWKEETPAPNSSDGGGQAQQDSPKNEPQRTPPKDKNKGGKPIRTSPPKKETAPDMTEAEIMKDLTETEVQGNEPS